LGDPFSVAGTGTFFSWMSDPVDGLITSKHRPAITRLQLEMHEARIDLQKAFPDPLGADRERFRDWLQNNAAKDFDLDSAFIITSDDVDRPVAARHLSILRFAVGRIARSLHRNLKISTRRILRPESYLFQKLRFFNKAYLERTSFGETPKTMTVLNLTSSLPFGVNVAGYIQGNSGWRKVARASVKSLLAVDIPQVLNNVYTHAYRHEDKSFDQISSGNPYRVNLVHVNADQVPEFARQMGDSYFQGRYNIGCWFWELSSFPSKWRSSFDYYQEIWVASGFCQESIASRSPIPVVKMTFPILIDESHAQPNRKLFGLPEDKFLYGFVFDYLSLAERKNPFGLIKAFNMAFEEQDDAFLVIKTINAEHAPEKADLLRKAAKDRKVQFIDGYLSRQDTISLVSSFDSFVSLHRSEGLGIGMAQAMFLKKPVIATGYSGNMEFMNHNNSFLVRYKLTELEENYGPYEKGNVWAEPDLEHAAELIRLVFDNRALSQQVAKRAELDIKTTMTPAVAGQEMRSRLLLVT
jgi:glycosyltransferase involved in cell wall biosynthesis